MALFPPYSAPCTFSHIRWCKSATDSTDSLSPRKDPNMSKEKSTESANGCHDTHCLLGITHVDEVCLVTGMQIMDNGSLVQMGKLCHIVRLVELGRVDLVDLVCIHFPLL